LPYQPETRGFCPRDPLTLDPYARLIDFQNGQEKISAQEKGRQQEEAKFQEEATRKEKVER
jgi:hypothetical protein